MYVRVSSAGSTRMGGFGRWLANPAIIGTFRCPQRRFGRNGPLNCKPVQGDLGADRLAAGFSRGAGGRVSLRGLDAARGCVQLPERREEVAP
jgi:hypothetical protein